MSQGSVVLYWNRRSAAQYYLRRKRYHLIIVPVLLDLSDRSRSSIGIRQDIRLDNVSSQVDWLSVMSANDLSEGYSACGLWFALPHFQDRFPSLSGDRFGLRCCSVRSIIF
jgi:hypothetical protein